MIARVRQVDIASPPVNGLDRRPSRADRTPLDLAAIRRWTHRNRLTRNVYFRENPPELPAVIPCECGGMFRTDQGLLIHRSQHCPLRVTS